MLSELKYLSSVILDLKSRIEAINIVPQETSDKSNDVKSSLPEKNIDKKPPKTSLDPISIGRDNLLIKGKNLKNNKG